MNDTAGQSVYEAALQSLAEERARNLSVARALVARALSAEVELADDSEGLTYVSAAPKALEAQRVQLHAAVDTLVDEVLAHWHGEAARHLRLRRRGLSVVEDTEPE